MAANKIVSSSILIEMLCRHWWIFLGETNVIRRMYRNDSSNFETTLVKLSEKICHVCTGFIDQQQLAKVPVRHCDGHKVMRHESELFIWVIQPKFDVINK